MIYIRADAGSRIGAGHVMRCMSIADRLLQAGMEVTFLVADEPSGRLPAERKFHTRILSTAYDEMEAELPLLAELFQPNRRDVLLVDSYFVTPHYLESLNRMAQVVYLDDRSAFAYPVDLVINYNIYATKPEKLFHPGTEYLLGTDYAPLRSEFCEAEKCKPVTAVKNVLLSTGASDPYDLAGRILEHFFENTIEASKESLVTEAALEHIQVPVNTLSEGITYHVVCGAYRELSERLCRLQKKHSNVKIYQNVTRMSELMQQCDVCITAAGSTMYELSAMGLPMLAFSFADNQEPIVRGFSERGLSLYGGSYTRLGEQLFEDLSVCMEQLVQKPLILQGYQQKLKKLVDCMGAERIAKELICREAGKKKSWQRMPNNKALE